MLRELVERPPTRPSATTRCGCSSARACRAGCGGASSERFAPARVLEFYASTEGEAVLVNLAGAKPGALGRPLPGSAEVRDRRLRRRARAACSRARDGFALRVPARRGRDAARARRARRRSRRASDSPLRGVFERDDAWLRDRRPVPPRRRRRLLARRPRPRARSAPPTGRVPALPIADALGDLDAVDLAVAYGVPAARRRPRRSRVAAVTLRDGHDARRRATSTRALRPLAPARAPARRARRRRDPADDVVPPARGAAARARPAARGPARLVRDGDVAYRRSSDRRTRRAAGARRCERRANLPRPADRLLGRSASALSRATCGPRARSQSRWSGVSRKPR